MKQDPSFKSPSFVIKIPSRREVSNKIRIVVSTKIAKKAVQRNKIKRRIKEVWRLLKIANIPPPHIYVRKNALNLSFSEIKSELDKVFKKYL